MYGMSFENPSLNGDVPVKADLIGANAFPQPAQSYLWGFGCKVSHRGDKMTGTVENSQSLLT
jgi:hypothetical protein